VDKVGELRTSLRVKVISGKNCPIIFTAYLIKDLIIF